MNKEKTTNRTNKNLSLKFINKKIGLQENDEISYRSMVNGKRGTFL